MGVPQPGDLSVCIKCAMPLEFGEKLDLQPLSQSGFNLLPDDIQEAVKRYQRAVRRVDRR